METNDGRTPKRRKTAHGPPTAQEITQANSTAQLFAGQRQSRWMHANMETAPPRSMTETTPGEHSRTKSGGLGDLEKVPEAPAMQNMPGATNANKTLRPPVALSSLTHYESPMHGSPDQPGPSSPDRSESALPSPAFAAMQPQGVPVAKRGRGRPRLYPEPIPPGQPVAVQSAPPGTTTPQSLPSQTSMRQMPPPQAPFSFNVNTTDHRPQQVQRQPLYPLRDLYPDVLRARIQAFKQTLINQPQGRSSVVQGRIILLLEAVDQDDWFYIVLSQIQALQTYRDAATLPKVVQDLPTQSFRYLDILLSTNEGVNIPIIKWLAGFPIPLAGPNNIYDAADPALRPYEQNVINVCQFMQLLPQRWDELVKFCSQRQAPPLVEELWERLGLASRVLQSTVFRAISRSILATSTVSSDPVDGIQALVYLHELNQHHFFQNRRRDRAQMNHAYDALRGVLEAWGKYQQDVQHAQQLHKQAGATYHPPKFIIPPQIVQVFQTAPSTPVLVSVSQSRSQSQGGPMQTSSTIGPGPPIARTSSGTTSSRAPPASRSRSRPISNDQTTMWQIAVPKQMLPPSIKLVFPHENDMPRPQPTDPDPKRSALHQAHLRSPTLTPVDAFDEKKRLYRHVISFAVSPRKVDRVMRMDRLHFNISDEEFRKIPATVISDKGAGHRSMRTLTSTSRTYRLRCVNMPAKGIPNEKTWVEADGVWPESLFLAINDEMLETRRKLHHNRYLPIDLTGFLRPGDNVLTVCANRISTDPRPFEYALAVEVVGVSAHEDIVARVNHVSAEESLAAVKRSLSGADANDDDVAVTSSNMIIGLFDPYYADRIVQTPVRGSGCLHRACFDLETFLAMCKREQPDWPTIVDCWRCPICRGDVRPQTLIKDGFLVEVRKTLEEKGMLNTRAIVVDSDGIWKPKAEERTGEKNPSLEREERSDSGVGVNGRGSAPPKKAPPVVIELD